MSALLQETLPVWIAAVFAVLSCLAAAGTLYLQWQERRIKLKVLQEAYWGADNQKGGLPRFVIHNTGMKAINIADVMVDTLPNVFYHDWREGTVATSMEVKDGEVPGWLRPGHHIRLSAYEAANSLRKNGFSGEVGTELVVVDALSKEHRYPVTLKVEGENNKGEFDLESHW